MTDKIAFPRMAILVASFLTGGLLCWLTASQMGLLLPIVAVAHRCDRTILFATCGVLVLALAGTIAVSWAIPDEMGVVLFSWATFFAVALGCVVIVVVSRPTPVAAIEPAIGGRHPPVLTPEFLSLVHPDDRDLASHASSRAFWSGFPQIVRYRLLQSDGSYSWTEFRAEPGYTIADDRPAKISAQELPWSTTDALGETAEAARIALVLETIFGTGWAMDTTGRFTYATPNAQTTIGQTLEEMNKQLTELDFLDGGDLGWKEIFHPDEYERVAASLRHSLKAGEHWNNEYRLRRVSTGEFGWHRVAMRPTRDRVGRITGWYGMSIDITVYKQTEAALRVREQELSHLINMVPVHIIRLSGAGKPTFLSKATLDYFALDDRYADHSDETLAAMQSAIHPDDALRVTSALRSGVERGDRIAVRYRVRGADGIFRWMDSRAEPIRDVSGTIVEWYAVSLDVNDQVVAQEELRLAHEDLAKATQAANLAELSASIAHEVAQPLAALLSSSDACQRWLSLDPPNLDRAQQALQRIIRSGNAATGIVSRIRALFAQSADVREPSDISRIVFEARELLTEELMRHGVRLEIEIDPAIPILRLDRIQIQQAMINLMRNGIEAIGPNSDIKTLGIRVKHVGAAVQVAISDSGPGVENPSKIFDPFYTTKGQGMGMGLAICRSIVTSHGGRLWVEKNEPHGAVFIFTLPISEASTDGSTQPEAH
ncbi:PAS domain S-box-containing protein [Rhizobium sp. BK529]|uniref:PAS domain-containing sensor histidine kinase n=1 Tax=Rhizobium sp. BK529 TaxID=2586983 RepID=UPI001621037F|nr:PAS domain-containing protein [Rhizobium sp. BK529]MBB3595137.1 PAS domain S-box-containing protein [Rhizobium sp. BK529]